jgi:LysM repeat protein
MKKEVQALIKRRRARVFPAVLLAIAAVIIVALILLVVAAFAGGSRLVAMLSSATPTATITATPRPTSTPVPPTFTPAATATATDTPGPSPTPTQVVYVVQEGDTLFTIAEAFKANVCLIMAVNSITDPGVLLVGQSLVIPPDDVELPTPTPLPTGIPRGARIEYVVQCGDTLDSIAAKFDSTGADIQKTNNIKDPLSIQIGQVLIVRVNIATPTPTAAPTNTAAAAGSPPATATITPAP